MFLDSLIFQIDFLIGVDFVISQATGYIPIISTLLGVFMGLVSSEISNSRKDKRRKRRKINSTRTLISLENDRNLDLLKDFWFKLNNSDEIEEESDVEGHTLKIQLAHKLIKMPIPSWNEIMWNKQASLLAITFEDKEIISVSSFNNCLDTLKSIYCKLVDLDTKDRDYNSTYASGGISLDSIPHSNRFNEEAPSLWDEFEKITLNLIENGNPLIKMKTKN